MTSDIDQASDLALAACASEPIRAPGAIQPHGYLLAFDAESQELQHASANVFALVDARCHAVLGRPLAEWLDAASSRALHTALIAFAADPAGSEFALEINGRMFNASMHRVDTLCVVELEPCVASGVDSAPLLARTLWRLQSAVGLQALHEITVREIRELTGCDRVVIHAFNADGHGQVLAEAKADDVASYLGLHFPASDVPTQARALYTLNWLRMIPDVDYEPVPILGLQTAAAGAPLDLTYATLRSVSPVHREYMRHMGSASSMSISLLRGGKLWGLVSCVHRHPKLLTREVRAACLALGRLLSLQISALEGLQESHLMEANESLLDPLVACLQRTSGDTLANLQDAPEHVLRLVDATGAAIVTGDVVLAVGECPDAEQVLALARWVAQKAPRSGHYASHQLPAEYPASAAFAQVACGLLAIVLPKPDLSMVLWFRPEATRTVSWAGDPHKLPTRDARTAMLRLSPRHSFELWKTLLRNQAVVWAPHQVRAARDLRRVAIELDLAEQVVRERQAVASRDELLAIVSHDLRSPLTVVALQASSMIRTLNGQEGAPSRRVLTAAQSIQRASSRMSEMLRDLLDLSKIEQGRYSIDASAHSVEEIFEDAEALLAPIAGTRRITLTFVHDPGLTVRVDVERIYQVISNLVGNALKFTAEGGWVAVSARPSAKPGSRCVEFVVSDTGPGMSVEQIGHIFERYWCVRDANPNGSGLGLYIAQGIVHAHGGEIWAESTLGAGSTFYFTVPMAPLAAAPA